MTGEKPNLARAPVVEAVLGIQFDPIPDLTEGHLGMFWGTIKDRYALCQTQPPIQQRPDPTDPALRFAQIVMGFEASQGESRLQLVTRDRTKMVQVQNGWFVTNWMKREGHAYPRSGPVKEDFLKMYREWAAFLRVQGLSDIKPNQWEVTYIDHIPAGTVWSDSKDWAKVFPGLVGPCQFGSGSVVSKKVDTTVNLADNRGVLRLSLENGRMVASPTADVLILRSIALGPVRNDAGATNSEAAVMAGLDIGHRAVVDTFFEIAGSEAVEYWKKGPQ